MGGAVKPASRTPAEFTVLLLQQAADRGATVSIPGAWEARAARPAARPIVDAEPLTMLHAPPPVVSSRDRLERELEGGGAPSERGRGHRSTLLARLWRTMLHPAEIAVIWSGALPE